MKSVVMPPSPEELTFPCLMEGEKGLVVLMTEPCKGMVIVANANHSLGKTSEHWTMRTFKPFNGSVTLSN